MFLLLTILCEFYDYEKIKPFTIHVFYQFLINLIQQNLIIFILTIIMNYVKHYYLHLKAIVFVSSKM